MGKIESPTKWAVELDNTDEGFGEGKDAVDHVKPKPGVKANKGGKGAKAKQKPGKQQCGGEDAEEDGKRVVAQFNVDGAVTGLRCCCVRNIQVPLQVNFTHTASREV